MWSIKPKYFFKNVCIRIITNFRLSFVVVRICTIIILWFVYYTRHSMVSCMNYPSLNSVGSCGSWYSLRWWWWWWWWSSQGTAYVMRPSSVLELLEHIFINMSLNICEEKRLIQRHSPTVTPRPLKDNISCVLTDDLTFFPLLSCNMTRYVLLRKYL